MGKDIKHGELRASVSAFIIFGCKTCVSKLTDGEGLVFVAHYAACVQISMEQSLHIHKNLYVQICTKCAVGNCTCAYEWNFSLSNTAPLLRAMSVRMFYNTRKRKSKHFNAFKRRTLRMQLKFMYVCIIHA
jgi:hypothetical protein